jgi:putative endonuclease
MVMEATDSKPNIGKIGELTAEKYLKAKRYKILDKNYFLKTKTGVKLGEIDIIAKKDKTIVFVEVKAITQRRGRGFLPEDKVNRRKKKKLIMVSEKWLQKNKMPLTTARQIDIIAIELDLENRKARLRHYENAIENKDY